MGSQQSNAGAAKFFGGVGGILEKGANTAINLASVPSQLAGSLTNFMNNPLSAIAIPIILLGGLYVISQK